MDYLPDRVDSKYRYVLLAAGRAEQLMLGARPNGDEVYSKPTQQGMTEISGDLVHWDYGPAPEPALEDPAQEAEAVE